MLPAPPVVVPVAALDLVGGGGGAPAEPVGEGRRGRRHGPGPYRTAASAMMGAMSQDAVDDLVKLLDLEPIEVNIFRGRVPRRGPPAGVRRPGGRPGAGGRGPHRRARPLASTRCTPTSCAPATPPCRSSTRSTASATAARSPPAASWPSSTARRSSTCSRASRCTRTGLDHQDADARGAPPGGRCPTSRTRMAPYAEALGDWYHRPRPIDIRHVDWNPPDRQRAAAAATSGCGCGPTAACPTTRCSTPACSPTPAT